MIWGYHYFRKHPNVDSLMPPFYSSFEHLVFIRVHIPWGLSILATPMTKTVSWHAFRTWPPGVSLPNHQGTNLKLLVCWSMFDDFNIFQTYQVRINMLIQYILCHIVSCASWFNLINSEWFLFTSPWTGAIPCMGYVNNSKESTIFLYQLSSWSLYIMWLTLIGSNIGLVRRWWFRNPANHLGMVLKPW